MSDLIPDHWITDTYFPRKREIEPETPYCTRCEELSDTLCANNYCPTCHEEICENDDD